jgi:hypothetical protein
MGDGAVGCDNGEAVKHFWHERSESYFLFFCIYHRARRIN